MTSALDVVLRCRTALPGLKNELFDDGSWPSRSIARTAVFEWIEGWYNSSLGYRSPADYEAALAA